MKQSGTRLRPLDMRVPFPFFFLNLSASLVHRYSEVVARQRQITIDQLVQSLNSSSESDPLVGQALSQKLKVNLRCKQIP